MLIRAHGGRKSNFKRTYWRCQTIIQLMTRKKAFGFRNIDLHARYAYS